MRDRLKGLRKRLRAAYARVFLRFTEQDLKASLTVVGLRPGDIVLVHSAYRRFEGFTGDPVSAIRAIQDVIGPEGTLLMPQQPMSGSAVSWAKSGRVWDQGRTPTLMGILPEYFRRQPGVKRSLHPTHSVAAWGRLQSEMLDGHLSADSPCGTGSPYMKLWERGGKVLHLGSTILSTTFLHTTDEMLEPLMPVSPFTKERFTIPCKDESGRLHHCECRLFDETVAKWREVKRIIPPIKAHGYWRETKLSNLPVSLFETRQIAEVLSEMAQAGRFFYDFERNAPFQ